MGVLGSSIRRREDLRLLTGRGRFVGDVRLPGMLHTAFVRSRVAHGRLIRLDVRQAGRGSALVLTAADLDAAPVLPIAIPHPQAHSRTPPPLAGERVRYVGEPIAAVVAAGRAEAEDLAAAIEVEYEPLPAVTDPEEALRPAAPLVHPEAPGNVLLRITQRVGDPDAALRRAAHVTRGRFRMARNSAQPLEPRAIVADPTQADGLEVWLAAQSPHQARALLAQALRLPPAVVRVICPDVGGSFGAKNRFYAEYVVVAAAALRLRRPVAWFGDRYEELVGAYQERDQVHEWTLGLNEQGQIAALSGRFISDNGAYDSGHSVVVPLTTAITVPGPYRVPNYSVELTAVYTNKPPLAPYRGAGRQQGIFTMERMLDAAARELGRDPAELRLRNLIPPEAMPYDVGLVRADGQGPVVYDSGDYPAALRAALDHGEYRRAREEQARLRADGIYRGLGLACYVESAGVGATDRVALRIEPSGLVRLFVGSACQGQGHETTWAQVCAQRLGVPVEQVVVVQGDTAAPAYSPGTFASRSAVAVGNAVGAAARRAREEVLRLAGRLLEVPPEVLELTDGRIVPRRGTGQSVGLEEVVSAAGGLEADGTFTVSELTYGHGVHFAEVEVEPTTGEVRIRRYLVVHDGGREFNPRIVLGQIIGGVAQGLGTALLEAIRFDADGQPLTATLQDYPLPAAVTVPSVEVIRLESPSPTNPEGVKGIGEGGAIPVPAAIVAAIEDALASFGVTFTEVPVTPQEIVRRVRATAGS